MTWCEDNFSSFNNTIRLDVARLARINGAIGRLETFCANDAELSAVQAGDLFLQGSVATGSVVKPLANNDFDVDIVYPFKLGEFAGTPSSGQVMAWFEGRFKGSEFYAPRIIEKDRCVRIDYAGDFHLDITPSTQDITNRQPWAIAVRDSQQWEASDPVRFKNWVDRVDNNSGGLDTNGDGYFIRCARYVKRWRDSFFSAEEAIKSITLVTALGNHDAARSNYNPPLEDPLFPQYQTDAAYLFDMLRLTYSCILLGRKTAFRHPTLGDDLGGEWADDYLNDFLKEMDNCIQNLRAAIYEENEAQSVAYYKAALGATFPA